MNPIFYTFAFLLFIAVVLGIEGIYQWWNSHHGPAARRLDQRIRALSAGAHANGERLSILKERMLSNSASVHALMMRVPRIHLLDRIILQSGSSLTVGRLATHSVVALVLVPLAANFSPVQVPTLVTVVESGFRWSPFVHPGAPTSPFAFDQPPEYHAQSTPAPFRRSPIVGFVWGGSFAPNNPEGW